MKSGIEPPKKFDSTNRIGHLSGVDKNNQNQAQGVDNKMSFSAFDFFEAIETAAFARLCGHRLATGFDALTIDNTDRGLCFSACFLTHPFAQTIHYPLV